MTTATAVWSPDCMEPDEWADWQRLNPRLTMLGLREAERPCADCPLSYAAEMRTLSRCNGTPGGVEDDDHDPGGSDLLEPARSFVARLQRL